MAAIRRPAFEETSGDVACVDVHVNGAKTPSGVLYKTVSKYLSVPPGQYRFEVGPLARTPTPARTPAAHSRVRPRRTPSLYADVEPTCGSDRGIRTCAQDRR